MTEQEMHAYDAALKAAGRSLREAGESGLYLPEDEISEPPIDGAPMAE